MGLHDSVPLAIGRTSDRVIPVTVCNAGITGSLLQFRISDIQLRPESVSYTHLDVYKRQTIRKYPACRPNITIFFSWLSKLTLSFVPSISKNATYSSKIRKPVSYTHLDVYKRQYQCHILKRLYNLFRSHPTQQNFQRKFLEVHRMEFLYLDVYKRQAFCKDGSGKKCTTDV